MSVLLGLGPKWDTWRGVGIGFGLNKLNDLKFGYIYLIVHLGLKLVNWYECGIKSLYGCDWGWVKMKW